MRKFTVKAKLNSKGMIICSSQTQCIKCEDKRICEEIDFFIESPFESIEECMTPQRTYKRKHGRIKQKRYN